MTLRMDVMGDGIRMTICLPLSPFLLFSLLWIIVLPFETFVDCTLVGSYLFYSVCSLSAFSRQFPQPSFRIRRVQREGWNKGDVTTNFPFGFKISGGSIF